MDHIKHHGIIVLGIALSYHYIDTDGDAYEEIDKEIDKRRGGSHGSQCLGTYIPSKDYDIRCIEKKLKDTAEGKRDRKQEYLGEQSPIEHIDLVRLFHDSIFSPYIKSRRPFP